MASAKDYGEERSNFRDSIATSPEIYNRNRESVMLDHSAYINNYPRPALGATTEPASSPSNSRFSTPAKPALKNSNQTSSNGNGFSSPLPSVASNRPSTSQRISTLEMLRRPRDSDYTTPDTSENPSTRRKT